jgi:hypothetical protein
MLVEYYATSRKVVGSIPDENNVFFIWHNLSSLTMVLGWTQPLIWMSTRNLPGVKGGRRVRLTIPLSSVGRLSRKYGSFDVSQPSGSSRFVTGISLLFYTSNLSLGRPSGLFPTGSSGRTCICFSSLMLVLSWPSAAPWFYRCSNIG